MKGSGGDAGDRGFLGSWLDELRFLFGPGHSTLLVLLGLPLFYPVVLSWLYQDNVAVERPALIVDEDGSALSRRLTLDLDATQEIRVAGRPATVAEGLAAVRRGEAEMLLWIPPDFSSDVKRGQTGRLPVWVESSNMVTYAGGMPGLSNVVGALNEDLGARWFEEKGMTTATAEARVMPVLRDDRILFRPSMGYGDFLISGVFGVVVQQIVMVGLMVSFGIASERGSRRGRGRRALRELAGRGFAHAPFYLLGAAMLSWVMFRLAGWTLVRPLGMFGLFALMVLALLPMSLTFARLARDRFDAFLLLMFLSTPTFMASGYAWPANQMPGWVQAMAALFPITPALQGMRTVATATGDLGTVMPQVWRLLEQFGGWSLVLVASVWMGRWWDSRGAGVAEALPVPESVPDAG